MIGKSHRAGASASEPQKPLQEKYSLLRTNPDGFVLVLALLLEFGWRFLSTSSCRRLFLPLAYTASPGAWGLLVAADRDLSAYDAQTGGPRSSASLGTWAVGLNHCRLIRNGPSRFELLPLPFPAVRCTINSNSDNVQIGFPTLCQQTLRCP
jgi:hypothetical protein